MNGEYNVKGTTTFPAPLEVDRCLYKLVKMYQSALDKFPAPREVDRELYIYLSSNAAYDLEFPTPPEVDRELYKKIFIITAILIAVSGPSRGR